MYWGQQFLIDTHGGDCKLGRNPDAVQANVEDEEDGQMRKRATSGCNKEMQSRIYLKSPEVADLHCEIHACEISEYFFCQDIAQAQQAKR